MKYLVGVPLTLLAIVGVIVSALGYALMAPLAKLTGRSFSYSWRKP